jgi:hypothetical protein
MGHVKTTIELPDQLFREAKATAARRGTSLKNFVTAALQEKLARDTPSALREHAASYEVGNEDPGEWPYPPDPLDPEEHRIINERLAEFNQINPDTWK